MTAWITQLDFTILDWIQANLVTPFLSGIMILLSRAGDFCIPWLLLAIVMLLQKKYRKWGILLLCALGLEIICTDVVLKTVVARTRPFAFRPELQLLISPPNSYSFPSGHAGSCFACATSLLFTRKKRLWIPGLILAVLTAFSRIYLYVHYPSDVLAGSLLGILCAVVVYLFARPYILPHTRGEHC